MLQTSKSDSGAYTKAMRVRLAQYVPLGDEPPVRESDRGAERLDIIDGSNKDLSICGEDTMLDQLAGEYRRAN